MTEVHCQCTPAYLTARCASLPKSLFADEAVVEARSQVGRQCNGERYCHHLNGSRRFVSITALLSKQRRSHSHPLPIPIYPSHLCLVSQLITISLLERHNNEISLSRAVDRQAGPDGRTRQAHPCSVWVEAVPGVNDEPRSQDRGSCSRNRPSQDQKPSQAPSQQEPGGTQNQVLAVNQSQERIDGWWEL